MTERPAVAWMAYCLETGGRCFEHSEHRARERGRENYAPKEFVVWPLYTAGDLADWNGCVDGEDVKADGCSLGLSQLGAARLFGVGERTPRRWASEDATVPEPVAILLRLMLAGKITADDIETAKRHR